AAPGGLGSPSSVAVPWSATSAGSVIVWSGPAFTTGGGLGDGRTVIESTSDPDSAPSLAGRRTTYVPGRVNEARVWIWSGSSIAIGPSPDTTLHEYLSDDGLGRPSSVTVAVSWACEGSVTERLPVTLTTGGWLASVPDSTAPMSGALPAYEPGGSLSTVSPFHW